MNELALMDKIRVLIDEGKSELKGRLERVEKDGGLTLERYRRILSAQYHLNKNVQKTFLTIAANPKFSNKKSFRDFLYNFSLEEEPHYKIAEADLKNLNQTVIECPFPIVLWHRFFDIEVWESPLTRLGGTCVLENIGAGSADVLERLLTSAPYLNRKNTIYITIHKHGPNLPHGDQILEQIEKLELNEEDSNILIRGVKISTFLYLNVVDWALFDKFT